MSAMNTRFINLYWGMLLVGWSLTDSVGASAQHVSDTTTHMAATSDCSLFTEKVPEFPGGQRALTRFIRTHLRQPSEARKNQIAGRVFISYIIDEQGFINNITVLKGLGYGCDEEAIRVIGLMPCWIPACLSGKPVVVKYNLNLSFPPQ